nr:glycoside hydrolase family 38 C-terminal domain-containing protein [uncultured Enterocloster sp.]
MIMLQQRIGKFLSYLEKQIYPQKMELENIRFIQTEERFSNVEKLDTTAWELFDGREFWGGHREYYWFDMTARIPEEFEGKCVCFELLTGREGQWDATNPQFTCYVNGVLRQGLDVNHREVLLTESAKAGESYRIVLSAFTGDQNFKLKLQVSIKVLDRLTEKYYYDIKVPYETACLLDSEDRDYIAIIQTINESVNLVDFRQENSAEYRESIQKADGYMEQEFYKKRCSTENRPTICCVGHTHIDCAWMWTLKVTQDKAVRSFSTVLELMRRYPEYKFMSSQPLLYKFVKKNAPQVYEEIKRRVKEGRWETEGAMFVEADCNLSSGESLVRQIIYGKRFFKEEFGKDNIVLWLPDVFGYSAALPQIMKKTGIRYFMTTKINWNEFNRMPYDTFMWRGIDGTEILTHFIPTRDYQDGPKNANRTNFFTTYNGIINPSQVKGSWKRYSQKYLNQETLLAYGYGDGGGGPTTWMLENQRRLEKGIPGCPNTKQSHVREFFENLEAEVSTNKYLPTWSGELYLEYHRGTYTTMARNKKGNRKSEFAYENIEWLGVLEDCLSGQEYPRELLRWGWETILKNQFHDILPGSSIKEVYDDSKRDYEELLSRAHQEMDTQKQRLADGVKAKAGDVVVFNPNGFLGSGIVCFKSEEKITALERNGCLFPVQKTADGNCLFEVDMVPPRGYETFSLPENSDLQKENTLYVDTAHMENQYFILEFNEKGQFSRIFDKKCRRELLKPGQAGNVIMSYEDRPHNYDAWDINNYYTEKSWEVDQVESIEVLEKGPVRAALRIVHPYLQSRIVQTIYLYAETPRVDIRTEIDWREHLILLKDLFPVDIHTEEATFDIQYGNVTRPTYSNTSWDFAKFEVCAHKWIDLSEWGYGVSFLNDCKYGVSVRDGVVGLTMLKSPIYPNSEADKEYHEFWYSIYPHENGWRQGGTVRQAYQFNNTMTAAVKKLSGNDLPVKYSLAAVDKENIVIEVVKEAEDSDALIIRMYECYNARTNAVLKVGRTFKKAVECDMLENEEKELTCFDGKVNLTFHPFEIKTVKLI